MADVTLTGVRKDIIIDQGSTVDIRFTLRDEDDNPLDMTGYDLRMQVRSDYPSTSTLINCTLANGKLAWVDQDLGQFQLLLSPSDTTSIRFPADSPEQLDAVYDMEIVAPTSPPGTQKPWYGAFSIKREVTR